ncbi:MAG: hypothetical protein K1X94_11225 [Sandaracinaceae bacterium]|nr:hypothetical protein [Sandaracinaceae bacterium]
MTQLRRDEALEILRHLIRDAAGIPMVPGGTYQVRVSRFELPSYETRQHPPHRDPGALEAWRTRVTSFLARILAADDEVAVRWRGICESGWREADLEKAVGLLQGLESSIERLGLALAATPERNGVLDAERLAGLLSMLSFLHDDDLKAIVKRDLEDLAVSAANGAWKPCLLLCGSILEGVLVDVLDRNRAVAGTYMGKKRFPEDASLNQLVVIAADPKLLDDGGFLLSSTAAGLAGTITEHRDLIHPHAQVRGRINVDRPTAGAMVQVLELVLRDLADADARGDVAAYVTK